MRDNLSCTWYGVNNVIVTDGSSDGHTGTIVLILPNKRIKIKRDEDNLEVTVASYYIITTPVAQN